jgi:hypothetical protein
MKEDEMEGGAHARWVKHSYKMLVRKSEEKRPLGTPRRKQDHIKMGVKETG